MLYLKEINEEDAEKEWLYIRSLPKDENGFTNDYCAISYEDFIKSALPNQINMAKGIGLPEGYVPQTNFFLWLEENGKKEIVGFFRLRHFLNDWLKENGGHIGYGIAKEYRKRGVATEGLRLLLEKAKEIVKEDTILMSCHKDNHPSLRVMQKNGATIAWEDDKLYHTSIRIR